MLVSHLLFFFLARAGHPRAQYRSGTTTENKQTYKQMLVPCLQTTVEKEEGTSIREQRMGATGNESAKVKKDVEKNPNIKMPRWSVKVCHEDWVQSQHYVAKQLWEYIDAFYIGKGN